MTSSKDRHYFRPPGSLGRDIRDGLLYAAGFSLIAIAIIVLAGLSTLIGQRKFSGWSQLPLGLPLVIIGYFTAGVAGGIAFWTLRPLRRWLIGWVLTGFVISALVYGAIGLIGVLSYDVGANYWILSPRRRDGTSSRLFRSSRESSQAFQLASITGTRT